MDASGLEDVNAQDYPALENLISGSSGEIGAALIPVLNGEMPYNVSMPDAGEFERSLCGENEMIYTVAGDMLEPFVTAGKQLAAAGFGLKATASLLSTLEQREMGTMLSSMGDMLTVLGAIILAAGAMLCTAVVGAAGLLGGGL